MDTRIFVITHKKIAPIPSDIFVPMQVGRYGKEDFGYLSDVAGDNISSKNSSYCELTGMYWLWKNMKCDIIGMCHYRRYFVKDEKLLDKAYIENTIEQFPIIVPSSMAVPDKNLYEQYNRMHYIKDLHICRSVIQKMYPEYLLAFDYAMNISFITYANMWITKKEIFDRYCKWLFDILFEAEKEIDISGYDDYHKRVMGFLSERLFRVWLFMQDEKIKEENVKMIAPEDFDNADKKVALISKYTKLMLDPIVQLHKNQTTDKSLAEPFECNDDFDRKIPVWVCWFQGEDDMPEIVKLCVESLKRNVPKNKAIIKFITLENCMKYVTFTNSIIDKVNKGLISLTLLSDILRAELLYRYGGMWIDATYFVSQKISDEFFERDKIFTLRFKNPIWSTDITKGNWSGNIWYTKKNNHLFRFLMEAFWYYFENNDKIVDYYFIDYIIALAFNEFPDIRNSLEECEYSNEKVFDLDKYMNKKVSDDRIQKLKTESIFYKLNRRNEYVKENIAGEQTVYGYLTKQYLARINSSH